MLNRTGNKEDPWISFKNHSDEGLKTILYGENSFNKKPHTERGGGRCGFNVFVRKRGGEIGGSGQGVGQVSKSFEIFVGNTIIPKLEYFNTISPTNIMLGSGRRNIILNNDVISITPLDNSGEESMKVGIIIDKNQDNINQGIEADEEQKKREDAIRNEAMKEASAKEAEAEAALKKLQEDQLKLQEDQKNTRSIKCAAQANTEEIKRQLAEAENARQIAVDNNDLNEIRRQNAIKEAKAKAYAEAMADFEKASTEAELEELRLKQAADKAAAAKKAAEDAAVAAAKLQLEAEAAAKKASEEAVAKAAAEAEAAKELQEELKAQQLEEEKAKQEQEEKEKIKELEREKRKAEEALNRAANAATREQSRANQIISKTIKDDEKQAEQKEREEREQEIKELEKKQAIEYKTEKPIASPEDRYSYRKPMIDESHTHYSGGNIDTGFNLGITPYDSSYLFENINQRGDLNFFGPNIIKTYDIEHGVSNKKPAINKKRNNNPLIDEYNNKLNTKKIKRKSFVDSEGIDSERIDSEGIDSEGVDSEGVDSELDQFYNTNNQNTINEALRPNYFKY